MSDVIDRAVEAYNAAWAAHDESMLPVLVYDDPAEVQERRRVAQREHERKSKESHARFRANVEAAEIAAGCLEYTYMP